MLHSQVFSIVFVVSKSTRVISSRSFSAKVLLEDRRDVRRHRDLDALTERESCLADELRSVEREVAE